MITMPKLVAVLAVTALATAGIVGVSLDADDEAPAAAEAQRSFSEFTGQTRWGDCVGGDWTETKEMDFVREVPPPGFYCVQTTHEPFTDQRVTGEFRWWPSGEDNYGLGPTIDNGRWTVHDEEGAWIQRPSLYFEHTDGSGPGELVVMDGSGAYAGLTLVAESNHFDQVATWRGYILEGDQLPAPEITLPE